MKRWFFVSQLCTAWAMYGIAFAEFNVITALPVYRSIVQQIASNTVSVASIMQPGSDPHSFEPRASDIKRLQRSDLFIHTGLDLEAWKNPLLNATGRSDLDDSTSILDLSPSVTILEVPLPGSHATGQHLLGNPHYWLSPENARLIARAITTRLIQLLPVNRDIYEKNLAAFEHEIDLLNEEITSAKQNLEGKKILAYHDDWIYLTRALGLETPLYLEPGAGEAPTPSHIKKIRALLASKAIVLVIKDSDKNANPVAGTLAAEANIPLVTLAQQPGEIPGTEKYIDLLRNDISLLQNAAKDSGKSFPTPTPF